MSDKKVILVVDDDVDILEQTKILVENAGFSVVTAESSNEGWLKFQEIKPYACVLDLMMEEYDSGFILSHKIKKDAHGKTIPVFLVTSVANATGLRFDATTEDEKSWIKADAIMNKPVVIDDLISKIDEFYEKADAVK
ncbi:MAG: response regulator [Ignavibacteriaceae bacterium]|nr:response regulator [Ignavibacteriaceae bacterium]NUM69604.1 response regulator [Ignavibacteriaceae bacterium]